MIGSPLTIAAPSFQAGWLQLVRHLALNRWQQRNVVLHVTDPGALDADLHRKVCRFYEAHGLRTPKHDAYTIFPHKLYQGRGTSERLYRDYNRARGFYERVYPRLKRWGTYFRRLTHYDTDEGPVNQLRDVIGAIHRDSLTLRAAYTMVIQRPGRETVRRMGGPCLNYVAVQLEPDQRKQLGLLAVYRHHDVLTRAYGNYWGLCNLLCFMADETDSERGPLTCVSSRSYVDDKRTALRRFVEHL